MTSRWTRLAIVTAASALLLGAGPATAPSGMQERTTPSGLKIIDVRQQESAMTAAAGDLVWVHYTGRLQSNGQKFDSSLDRGANDPIAFALGSGRVIKGWDEGVAGMKVGDKRQLVIPPELGYGSQGTPGGPIPPNATLVFDVELVGIYRPAK